MSTTAGELVAAILADMQAASDAVDDAAGTAEYQHRLIALALIARHFLREQAKALTTPQDTLCDHQIRRDFRIRRRLARHAPRHGCRDLDAHMLCESGPRGGQGPSGPPVAIDGLRAPGAPRRSRTPRRTRSRRRVTIYLTDRPFRP